ncbi:MAG: twin transmembrane helix small protein [Methylococcales bacterium]|nr:twin transmembrane helix small protein [Methylococcales bacterium]MDP3839656.1 twin transmembrane helix small protein [Methylococcales bacterium]
MIKIIVILAFILIIISLGSALFHLIRPKSEEESEKTVKALTFRIVLSLVLFIFVFIMVATGLYKPQGIGAGMLMQKPVTVEPNK